MTETRTPPALRRPAYHVWMDPREDLTAESPELADAELVYHHVVVNHADQLRAELEGRKHGIVKPQDAPMHLSSLWVWAAMVRTKRYGGNFASFKLACVSYDGDKPADGQDPDPATEPDPTEASTS